MRFVNGTSREKEAGSKPYLLATTRPQVPPPTMTKS
jgi:hypothetical protein